MSSETIRFPQGPLVDLQTGFMTLEWQQWFQNPEYQTIIIGSPIDVPSGGTGLTSGTSGGILGFTSSTTMASSVSLTEDHIVLGGGAGATPTPLSDAGTITTVLHGNSSGEPFFDSVDLTTDVSGKLPVANGGTNSDTALSGSSIMVSNGISIVQGQPGNTTTVLHGNFTGLPSYGPVVEDDMTLVDVTTWNSTTSRHGFLPKLSNDPDTFLDGEGNWSTPTQVTAAAVAAVGYWSPLTNGDPVSPELIFDSNGDTISVFTPTP